jgi:hypothetical protein
MVAATMLLLLLLLLLLLVPAQYGIDCIVYFVVVASCVFVHV